LAIEHLHTDTIVGHLQDFSLKELILRGSEADIEVLDLKLLLKRINPWWWTATWRHASELECI